MIHSKSEKISSAVIYVIVGIIGTLALYPFIYVLSSSFSSGDAVNTGKVLLFPKEFTLNAYKKVFEEDALWLAYANTFYYTIFGTMVNLILTILGAYPLSKKRLKGRSQISFFIAFSMWFNAGMIPFYLNLRDLHLLNSRFGILIAFGITTFNVILMRTFFQSVPVSLEEAAQIDGASDWYILTRIYLPISKASMATIGLFYGVSRWNGYFWSMLLLSDDKKVPLQVILKKLIVEMSMNEETMDMVTSAEFSKETFMYATIIVSIIPVLIAYPYLQKHFTKGAMVGSVKG
ncbi:MAG: carbohydrate ABC transporter permease [Spirochaetaceae bacterium]